MKNLFVIQDSCFSSKTSSPFSLKKIVFELNPLLLKHGWIVFQICLFSSKSLSF